MHKIIDPADFYGWPRRLQSFWLGHAFNRIRGAYMKKRTAPAPDGLSVTAEGQAALDRMQGLD